MSFLDIIKTIHGYTAIIATLLLVVLLVFTLINYFSKKELDATFRKISLFTLIFFHLQLVFGVILLFSNTVLLDIFTSFKIQGKVSLMEHIPGNFLAVLMITLFHSKQKRSTNVSVMMLIFLLLGILFLGRTIMLVSGVLQ